MMPQATKQVRNWLFIVCGLIAFMVVFGGYVRLTRSGLSIVEWNVISGILPPIGEEAWQAEFAAYQQTPEFQKVNSDMTLSAYKVIFYNEYFHRLVARFVGLVVVLPFFYFLARKTIPWKQSGIYWVIIALFGFQGFMGWYMVSSGLVDRPAVSHFRLTAHLLLALLLLSISLWTALNLQWGAIRRQPEWMAGKWLSFVIIVLLVIQITYGGLVAGLKAGYVSDTFPLMFGYWVPPGLLSLVEPWWLNLVSSMPTVHFIHRWFAFAVLISVILVDVWAGRRGYAAAIRRAARLLLILTLVQITLGVSVIWFHVPIVLALIHQGTALMLFSTAIVLTHRIWSVAEEPAAAFQLQQAHV